MSGPKAIISLNAGSSSIKFGLYRIVERHLVHAAGGKIEGIGSAPHLVARRDDGTVLLERRWDNAGLTHEELLGELLAWAKDLLDPHDIIGIGHRVVHGGVDFSGPVRIDDTRQAQLEALCSLAPLHQPHNLAAIRVLRDRLPHIPQVACFDTAFHHAMPPVATRLAIPRALAAKGIRRYGFHGLSYAYILRQLREIDPVLARGRIIVAHLGSGASLCAIHEGRSIDTTMGFTALDGLMMGTRCGTLDPGVILHLIQHEGMGAQEVEATLYNRSGLLGVSGISGDMRALHASQAPEAAEAIELFIWRIAREIGALASSLGGVDGIVFTAGIGENDALVRAAVAQRLGWLGVQLDAAANDAHAPLINAAHSRVIVRVIPTDEERMIALGTLDVLQLC